MNTPTKITFSRIIIVVLLFVTLFVLSLIPGINNFTVFGPDSAPVTIIYLVMAIVFIVGSSTDWLDGYLARRNNQVTTLGKFLDPIADKMLVNATLIFLCAAPLFSNSENILSLNVFVVIVFIVRDLIVDAVRFMAATNGSKVIAASVFGKLKTIFQMVAIPVYLLNGFPFSYFDRSWPVGLRIADILMYIALFFSVLSGIIYLVKNKDAFIGKKSDK